MQKVAIVTGGSKGIGAAIVKRLNEAGYQVVSTYNKTLPESFIDGVIYKELDITGRSDCLSFVEGLVKEKLIPSLLVNNAGITKDAMFHRMDAQDWHDVINVNLLSLFNLTQPVYKLMKESNNGKIISVSSVNANKGQAGQTNYCASKAGIQGFTKALALEAARYGINVNSISPGYTETDMVKNIRTDILDTIIDEIPLKRLCKVEEIAEQVLFLASDAGNYITGANVEVNGGLY